MTILESLQRTVEMTKNWIEINFLKKADVDSSLNSISENPVQNKVINNEIDNLKKQIEKIDVSEPKLASITMFANAWTGTSSPYSQTVVIDGVYENSKIDLQPTLQVINILQNLGTSLMAVNDNCVVTVLAMGNKPNTDISTDILITDINVI